MFENHFFPPKLYQMFLYFVFLGLISGCTSLSESDSESPQISEEVSPESGQGREEKNIVLAENYMIASANPYATLAGAAILAEGGNAIDASVAVQLMLGLVEPQSSGLGGGALLVYYDAKAKELVALDGRETAPLAATPELFLDDNGEPLKFWDAVVGGRSVGTPGTVKVLEAAHEKYGSKEWSSLFESSIKQAQEGFIVTERLSTLVELAEESLKKFSPTSEYFFIDGTPIEAGHRLINSEYAQTLKAIAEGGSDAFYQGEIAQAIVDTVQNAPDNSGLLSLEDLERYKVVERKIVCAEYRQYDVCGMGPPTSGGVAIGQILGILNHFDLANLGEDNPESWRLIGDASRLAFADRGLYLADSDFIEVPVEGLLDSAYLAERAALLKEQKNSLEKVEPGTPESIELSYFNNFGADESLEFPSTSHFTIVDSWGNVVSMTTTIENGFGSRLMTNGFLLNNELTDFSFRAETKEGKQIANRVEALKRPRSSMSPTIVMKDDKPYMAIGSPGGSRIIGYTAQAIIAHIDWGMDIQQAISMPHAVNRFGTFDLEEGTDIVALQPSLEEMGYEVNVRDLNSGLHGIIIHDEGLEGGADPRRDGVVLGE